MGLEEIISKTSVYILIAATLLLIILTGISLKVKPLTAKMKKFLFSSIVIVILFPTLFMAVSTVYLNNVSASSGPVHWHADFEVWSCGKELNLKDPTGFSNKIGTATLHEHNDKRIHLEGVVVNPDDASLGKFFHVIGGEISDISFTLPTNTGSVSVNNTTLCPDGRTGTVQVFVYQTDKDNYYKQTKIHLPEHYTISPQSNVPAGDCIIVEFGPIKSRTDKLCRSYKVAQQIGKLKGEKPNGY